MTPNLAKMFSFANLKDNAALKSTFDVQTRMARLFAEHTSAQITAAGEMSKELFAAGAKFAAVAADPARFEESGQAISADLATGIKAQAEKMIATARNLQADVTAIYSEMAPKSA